MTHLMLLIVFVVIPLEDKFVEMLTSCNMFNSEIEKLTPYMCLLIVVGHCSRDHPHLCMSTDEKAFTPVFNVHLFRA